MISRSWFLALIGALPFVKPPNAPTFQNLMGYDHQPTRIDPTAFIFLAQNGVWVFDERGRRCISKPEQHG